MKKICILTYDTPHQKTADVFWGLYHSGRYEIDFLKMPFVKRPEREVVFSHRPPQFHGPELSDMAKTVNAKCIDYDDYPKILDKYDQFIVCGANLIEADFANTGRILNLHSGLIPMNRGLDSFKWAILNGIKLGNTLHVIDEHADKGEILAHLETPLYMSDTLEIFADRHYKNEIWMLHHFEHLMAHGKVGQYEEVEATRRMPKSKEEEMINQFEQYKERFAWG